MAMSASFRFHRFWGCLLCVPCVLCIVALAVLVNPRTAGALQELNYTEETFSTTYLVPYIPEFSKTPEGGLAWETLARTTEISYEEKNAEGMDIAGVRPDFPADVLALDGQEVLMQGYMFPLDAAEKQAQFLFGPFPATCPYHYHVGPAMVIEVSAAEPLPFVYDPVNLRGRLELVSRDDAFNVFYRLKEARLAE